MLDTMVMVKTEYEPRIRALLGRWRAACLERAWPTSEISEAFKRQPTGHPVHDWSFSATLESSRVAHVSITLETESDLADNDGFGTILNCFSSVSFGSRGYDYVKWEAPRVSEYLGDDWAINNKFELLEQVDGKELADAINQRTVTRTQTEELIRLRVRSERPMCSGRPSPVFLHDPGRFRSTR